MSAVLALGHQGTALLILQSTEYKTWLEQQPAATRNWINASGFSGKGIQLLPDADGKLLRALFVCDSLDDHFACGELANQLPAGDYYLENISHPDLLIRIAFAWGVGAYRFERYVKPGKAQARLFINDADSLRVATHLVNATATVRDLINTPAADMMPEHLSAAAQALAKEYGAQFSEVIGDELLTQNYPMIHAVGRASVHAPRLLNFVWGNEPDPKVTLVGKGVCFDSGGLDIKPGDAMRTMKKDMGGAAHVLGLAQLIMAEKLPVRLRVLIPAAENAVSANSFRPGDVLPTRKGSTVEIDNTDAEGRLVLCDAITEAISEQPELLIDYATLTGACRVALGTELPGFFTNQMQLASDLMQVSQGITDPVWNLPLHAPYKDMLKSDIADLSNSVPGPFGGAITAALYLEHFVENTPWVHFDVMAWNRRKLPGRPLGGEAMGMRAMFTYLQNRFATA